MLLLMIHGKVLQHLNETPGMVACSMCKANPLEMNKIDRILAREISEDY